MTLLWVFDSGHMGCSQCNVVMRGEHEQHDGRLCSCSMTTVSAHATLQINALL